MLRKPQESSSASLLRQNMTAANQICRSALGNSPDIKNRHKWITTAPRNPCQPYTQPQVLAGLTMAYGIAREMPLRTQNFSCLRILI